MTALALQTVLLWMFTFHIAFSRHTRILGLPEHRVRHSRHRLDSEAISNAVRGNSDIADEALPSAESSQVIEQLQRDILRSLGMREPPVTTGSIPDHMREVIMENIGVAADAAEEEHFMKDSVNILLTASKAHNEQFGETMEFTLRPADRTDRVVETKLYFHVNPLTVEMHNDNLTEPMHLRLSMLSESEAGVFTHEVLEDKIPIHSHLVGWHNHEIHSASLLRLLERQDSDDVKLYFQLQCTNCRYQLFPDVVTKQNVPFLTMNGRRRARRNGSRGCSGSCCLKELIVDFNALGSSWDFVIYPRRYQANYCAGSCVHPAPVDRAQMTSNTHILNAVLSRQQAAATSSCCVAADEERLLLAYYVDGGAVRTNDNVIKRINSCRCV